MNRSKTTATLSFALLAATFGFTSSARAQGGVEWNKVTHITIDQQMEVPGGVVLQPGKYVIRLLDSPSDRHIVEFLNDEQTHVFATINAINNYRLTPTGKTVFTFYEMPAGQPQAIRAWFYPGDNFGQEFIYKKHRGEELAKVTNTTVQTEPDNEVVQAPPEPAPVPEPQVAEAASAPAPAPEPAPQIAQNEPPPAPAPAPEPAPQTLPQTASDVPLYALIGFLSLGAALSVRSLGKRTN